MTTTRHTLNRLAALGVDLHWQDGASSVSGVAFSLGERRVVTLNPRAQGSLNELLAEVVAWAEGQPSAFQTVNPSA